MRHRDVERRLAELDREDEHEPDECGNREHDDRQVDHEHLAHHERVHRHVETHGHEQHHRLVRHDLNGLARRADFGIGAARRICGHDEEQGRHGDDESAHEQVIAREEDASRERREDERARHVHAIDAADRDVVFLQKLAHVVIRLQQRRSHAPLHAGGDDAFEACEQATHNGRQDRKGHSADQHRYERE